MANRYQSIVDQISADVITELRSSLSLLGAEFRVKEGHLVVVERDEALIFDFEEGDPDSEAIAFLLTNLPRIIQTLEHLQGVRKA